MDNRKFSSSISVRIGTSRVKLELSPASLHAGPEGMFRVRMQRRWLDTPEGKARFLDRADLAALVAELALGEVPEAGPMPDFPYATRVALASEDDRHLDAMGFTTSPPIRAQDGLWYVAVSTYGRPVTFYPASMVRRIW